MSRPTGVCIDYQRGECNRGESCFFFHVEDTQALNEKCRHFQQGICTRDPCPFVHEHEAKSFEVCREFQRGECTRDPCRFLHQREELADFERLALHNYVYVDADEALAKAVQKLSLSRQIAFDAEGVDLSRHGSLTLACFLPMDIANSPVYVVDIQVLGAEKVFPSSEGLSFRTLLESSEIEKVTFDCRSDSDALFHQYGVLLSGVLELQVLDQAVRIQRGEPVPIPSAYAKVGFLQSMGKVAERYLATRQFQDKLKIAPHQRDPQVWAKRPLDPNTIQYAANDVVMIKDMLASMSKTEVCAVLMDGVRKHSARYEKCFRETKEVVTDKASRMTEYPIIDKKIVAHLQRELPHPALETWEKTTGKLLQGSADRKLFGEVMFVVKHDAWYTPEARVYLKTLILECRCFNGSQKQKILNELVSHSARDAIRK